MIILTINTLQHMLKAVAPMLESNFIIIIINIIVISINRTIIMCIIVV